MSSDNSNFAKKMTKILSETAQVDEASSGVWFDGWRAGVRVPSRSDPPEVARPHSWLLCVGWKRHRLIDVAEVPG